MDLWECMMKVLKKNSKLSGAGEFNKGDAGTKPQQSVITRTHLKSVGVEALNVYGSNFGRPFYLRKMKKTTKKRTPHVNAFACVQKGNGLHNTENCRGCKKIRLERKQKFESWGVSCQHWGQRREITWPEQKTGSKKESGTPDTAVGGIPRDEVGKRAHRFRQTGVNSAV